MQRAVLRSGFASSRRLKGKDDEAEEEDRGEVEGTW